MIKKLFIFFALVVGISIFQQSSAFAATLTWTGAANNNMNNEVNWNPMIVPEDGDDLIFPANVGGTVNNDLHIIPNSVVFGQGASSSTIYSYSMTGSCFDVESLIRAYGSATINLGCLGIASGIPEVALFQIDIVDNGGALSIGATSFRYDGSSGHELDTLLLQGSGSISFTQSSAGQGSVDRLDIADGIRVAVFGAGIFNPAYTRLFDTAQLTVSTPGILGSLTTLVNDSAILNLVGGSSYNRNITFEDGTSIHSLLGDEVIVSGDITLQGQVDYEGDSDLRLTGNITGPGKITPIEGNVGSVFTAPAVGKTNTSGQPNGETKPAVKTTTINNNNSNALEIYKNNIAVVNGQRGYTTVYSGGVLKGNGIVGELTVNTGGRLAPGNSPGCLTSGNLTLAGTYDVELAGATRCSQYDSMTVNGTVDLTDSTLNLIHFNNYRPALNSVYEIIQNDGSDAITGTFTGVAEGGAVVLDGYTYTVSYVGGTGNDVTLTVTAIPAGANPAGSGATVGVPNTGLKLLLANPIAALIAGLAAAGSIYYLVRRRSAHTA